MERAIDKQMKEYPIGVYIISQRVNGSVETVPGGAMCNILGYTRDEITELVRTTLTTDLPTDNELLLLCGIEAQDTARTIKTYRAYLATRGQE